MFGGTPIFVRMRSSRFAPQGRASWLWLAPGIALLTLAAAIMIWPELLAYLVATALAMLGVALTAWGWTMRQVTRAAQRAEEDRPTYRVYPGQVL